MIDKTRWGRFSTLSTAGAKQKTARYASGEEMRIANKKTLCVRWQVFKPPPDEERCKYHIVFRPKYRGKIIYNQYKTSVVGILKDLCKK